MTEYDTVLFDNDGILVEPPIFESQRDATRAAFEAMGIGTIDQSHIVAIVNGVTVEGLHEICTAYDLDADAFWDARERHDEQAQLDDFRTGVRDRYDDIEIIEDLPQNGGVVSNNHHSTIEFVLDFFELHSLFDIYYGRENGVESLELKKPNPHYLDRALADLDAESALYVGDSESDVVAAHRAGMDSVFVRRSHSRDVNLSVTPTHETSDLYELKNVLDG